MNTRDKMIKWRNKRKVSHEIIAKKCGISIVLLKMVENGEVTHPEIAKRIQEVYGLTDLETEELLPEIRRPSSDKYDPDKYTPNFSSIDLKVPPKQSLVERYITEVHNKQAIQHSKRSNY